MESHVRSIIKAFSWRLLATVITFAVAWILMRRVTLAAEIGVADTPLKLGAYYSQERLWSRLSFGRQRPPEYQI